MATETSIPRSPGMIEVAYFLSKYGTVSPDGKQSKPPRRLGDISWKKAYDLFYAAFGDGRSKKTFRNSLKNQRDAFDGHVNSGRRGWRQLVEGRPAAPLSDRNRQYFERLEAMSEEEVWSVIRGYIRHGSSAITRRVKEDLSGQRAARTESTARTEGGRKVQLSYKTERDPGLRSSALEHHGFICRVCGFDFYAAYGEWGQGYAEVHHLVPLGGESGGKRKTDPSRDLTVLCANCHRMVHRKRGIALTVDELKAKLNPEYFRRRSR